MATTINSAYINALLADASYVQLIDGLSGDDLEGTPGFSSRMTSTLAQFIADNFTVISAHDSADAPFGWSFEGVVWQGNAGTPYAGQTYVSMRGTQQLTDFLVDGDLALLGAAREQIAEMVNWWLRITTAEGEPALQIENLSSPTVDGNGQYQYFRFIEPVPGEGKLTGATTIEVNGHSLGGHLATAFARIFGGSTDISHISTFNSAGFTLGSEVVFQSLQNMLGTGMNAFPSSEEQTNYFAANGLSVTTNSFWFNQIGHRLELFNEEGTGFPNHYMYKLTDALALGDALAKLDSTFDIARLNALLAKGSNVAAGSLEGILDGLRKTLGVSPFAATQIGDVSDSNPTRVAYHTNLEELRKNAFFQSLVGRVKIVEAPTDGLAAKTDFGALLSLVFLTPFSLEPIDSEASGKLEAAHVALAAQWNEDRSSSAEDKAAGNVNFSDAYLKDRAAMLSWVVKRNLEDNTDTTLSSSNEQYFRDIATNTTIRTGTQFFLPTGDLDKRRFLFGGDSADILAGGSKNDNLYGGLGNDRIDGADSNDYLEGNAGNDTLIGGSGRDTLLGGDGDDLLDGSLGGDVLKGGDGNDTYLLQSGQGLITIFDSQGDGQIEIDGVLLNGGKKITSDYWVSDDKKYDFMKLSAADGGTDLLINRAGSSDTIIIRGWQNGYLGIQLLDGDEPAPVVTPVVNGTADGEELDGENVATVINGFGGNDLLYARDGNDTLLGGDGNDALAGRDGDDLLEGGADVDVLMGGLGKDTLIGGDGNDVIHGSGRGEYTFHKSTTYSGNEVAIGLNWHLYPVGQSVGFFNVDVTQQFDDESNVIEGGAGNDTIFSGSGDDLGRGGEGDDEVWGLAGNDKLYGEGGKDRIFGDGHPNQNQVVHYTPTALEGIDFIDGGDGDDELYGQGKGDVLFGGAGHDWLEGDSGTTEISNHGNDVLDGGAGDDFLRGAGMDDQLFGGDDNDTLRGDDTDEYVPAAYQGRDYLDGGSGDDDMQGQGGNDTLYGGSGNDSLFGDDVANEVAGAIHGDDYLDGEAGNDFMAGDGGNDSLFGGEGDDHMQGDRTGFDGQFHGNDILHGGEGNDSIWGGGGADLLSGGEGIDYLFGDDPQLAGQFHGNDFLLGGDGDDQLHGGGGNDTLEGGRGRDHLAGGEGDDIYLLNAGDSPVVDDLMDGIFDADGKNAVFFGAGVSTSDLQLFLSVDEELIVSYGVSDEIYIKDGLNGAIGEFVFDDGTAIRGAELIGKGLNNEVTVSSDKAEALITGGRRSDFLTISGANSTVSGGQGDDHITITGENSTALFLHGDGYDQITGHGVKVLRFGSGITADSLRLTRSTSYDPVSQDYKTRYTLHYGTMGDRVVFDDSPGILHMRYELVDGEALSHMQVLEQSSLPLTWKGTANAEVISGTSMNDVLEGEGGGDTLHGEAGDDRIIAGSSDVGAYFLYGGAGNDTLDGGGSPGGSMDGGDGNDWLYGSAGSDMLLGGEGNDGLYSYDGDDSLDGGDGRDTLVGGAGQDTLYGGEGDDALSGEDGDDILNGGSGNDSLWGGRGNDTLSSGDGNDILRGNEGDDTYLIEAGQGETVIDDNVGANTIVLGAGIDTQLITGDYVNGTDGNLYLSLGLNNGHRLHVRSSFGDDINGTTTYRTIDGDVLTQNDFANLLLNPINYTADNNTAIQLKGSRFDDILIGSSLDDRIEGGDGDDQIAGGKGADSLIGGNGGDLLVGNLGNDLLSGGTGADTYRLERGMGHDRIIEEGSDLNTLQLKTGLSINDFVAIQQGENLLLTIKNSAEGVTIKNYFTSSANWQVMEEDGSLISLAAALPNLIPPSPAITLLEKWEEFKERVAESYRADLVAAGYAEKLDGSFSRSTNQNDTYYSTYSTYHVSMKYMTEVIDEIEYQSQLPKSQLLFATSKVSSSKITLQQTSTDGASFVSGSSITGPYYVDLAQGSNGNGYSQPIGTLTVPVYSSNSWINPLTGISGHEIVGWWVYPSDQQVLSTYNQQVTHQRTDIERQYQINILQLISDDASNGVITVDEQARTLLDAGDGNDVVYGNYAAFEFDWISIGLFNDTNVQEVGNFLYGNDGNDAIYGGRFNDVIIGGAGDDQMEGGNGSDVYVIGAEEGADTIFDLDNGNDSIDILELPAGVTFDDLQITWVEVVTSGPESSSFHNVTSAYWAIDVSWGTDQTVRIFVPHFVENGGTGIELFRFSNGTTADFNQVLQFAPVPVADAFNLNNVIIGAVGSTTEIHGGGGDDILTLTAAGAIYGGTGSDILTGSAGNDVLAGGDKYSIWGDDGSHYRGGKGDDQIYANAGDDIFEYSLGDGYDVVTDHRHHPRYHYYGGEFVQQFYGWVDVDAASAEHQQQLADGQDTLRFGVGINASDVTLVRHQDHLVVSITGADDDADVDDTSDAGHWNLPTVFNDWGSTLEPFSGQSGGILFQNWFAEKKPSYFGDAPGVVLENQLSRIEFSDGTVWIVNQDGTVSLPDNSPSDINGTSAADQLQGTDGADKLTGFDGDDTISGGLGDDLYIYSQNDGIDHIVDTGGFDTIQFGDGIDSDSLSLGVGSLLVRVGSDTNAIHIDGFDPFNPLDSAVIENFTFADGTNLTYEELLNRGFDLFGAGEISGTSLVDRINGSDGIDTIAGEAGNDTLNGARGNDSLDGGAGDDAYAYLNGDGLDTIADSAGNDTVKFGAGLTVDQLALRLTTESGITTAHVRVLDINGSEQPDQGLDFVMQTENSQGGDLTSLISPIEAFEFADGSIKTWTDLQIQTQYITGADGQQNISGGRHDDVIHAAPLVRSTIHGGTGNDVIHAWHDSDGETVYSVSPEDRLYGDGGDDILYGANRKEQLDGGYGHDLLFGGGNYDVLTDAEGNNAFFGEQGWDVIVGGEGNEFIAGGEDVDYITTGAGANVVAFNLGDSADTIFLSEGANNTLSLGGGIRQSDLTMFKSGNDLTINLGGRNMISLAGWYLGSNHQYFDTLQIIEAASVDYQPLGSDKLHDNRVETFDFKKLIQQFEASGAGTSWADPWSVMNGMLEAHLGGSDSEAIGGELAYQYGMMGASLAPTLTSVPDSLKKASFGSQAQSIYGDVP